MTLPPDFDELVARGLEQPERSRRPSRDIPDLRISESHDLLVGGRAGRRQHVRLGRPV